MIQLTKREEEIKTGIRGEKKEAAKIVCLLEYHRQP